MNIQTILLGFTSTFFGTVICLSGYIVTNSLAFWYDVGGRSAIPYAVSEIGQYARYPISIYPRPMQAVLLLVIPYAFIGMAPALIVLNRHREVWLIALIGMSVVSFLTARAVFYRGIGKYESVGM